MVRWANSPQRRALAEYIAPYWRSFVLVIAPLVWLPIPLVAQTSEARCGYVILIMAVFWGTEAVPVAVTALIPVFALPLLGILSTGDVCIVYIKETNMMFLGGLTVAIAVEHCNLHRRIALRVILLVGQSPRSLMAGFMFTTMFLSMWISNTATTAMMVPIVDAILVELYSSREVNENTTHTIEMDMSIAPAKSSQMDLVQQDASDYSKSEKVEPYPSLDNLSTITTVANPSTKYQKENEALSTTGVTTTPPDSTSRALRDMCFLATAYSANIGGTGSLTGTGPNLVVKGVLASSYSEPTGLNFLTWMMFNVPGMLICVILAWVWLQIRYLGLFRKKTELAQEVPEERKRAVKQFVEQKYRDLGPVRFQEVVVLVLFIILVFLCLFRAPDFIEGWAGYFEHTFGVEVDDATPAMFIVFLLFCFSTKLNFWCFRKPGDPPKDPKDKNEVLTWKVVQEKIPWGVVLLLGGGFAMAEGSKASGLSKWLGEQLYVFNGVNKGVIVLIVTLMVAMLTEVASNSATASIILPVLNELALNINVNPLYLMLPAAVCCSYAFMLPVATPPNAIVFSVADMKSSEMMKAGIVMNIVCVLVLNVMINTLGVVIFDLNTMPAWTNSSLTHTF
ncbi:solute carrier family 13 member 2-like isoform X2 [Eriocheir sinensis]|nr:solute carrier family 13 member 2-like isoform X2 [Eriocheir sinensis]